MAPESVSRFVVPQRWIRYDAVALLDLLIQAKTAGGVLNRMPFLPQWIEQVHEEQLRLEAAATSRIEGAEFTQREQDEALAPDASARSDFTRSQRQLRSADATYRWLRSQSREQPVTPEFILNIHRRIVTGCDDDRCQPGGLRPDGWNLTFGTPRCRGVEGGRSCRAAFEALGSAIAREFQGHDRIIQAMAAHYHIGAMHPFGDGNGRTARALEAFMLRGAGVNNVVMVSLSNYYYDRKEEYLAALSETRRNGHDLTPFLRFGLQGVAERCNAVAESIVANHRRTLFREFARSLFGRLRSPRRRVLAERHLRMLDILLAGDSLGTSEFLTRAFVHYQGLKFPANALGRDLGALLGLEAIALDAERIRVNLDWPQQFSESALLEKYENMPSAATPRHPAMAELSRLLSRSRTTIG